MNKSSKLSSIGGLIVAGAALGLYLGSSAISEINPAYYSTPFAASSFHTDLVPNPGDRDSAQALPELAEVVTDVRASCVSCSLAPDEYALINYPSADNYGSYAAAPAEAVVAEADEYVSQGLSPREASDIARYAHYRVSEDEAAPAPAAETEQERSEEAAANSEDEGAPAI
jgi:hypothetical protein